MSVFPEDDKYFTHMNSSSFHNYPVGLVLVLSPLRSWENWGTEKTCDLAKATAGRGGTGIWTQDIWLQSYTLTLYIMFPP